MSNRLASYALALLAAAVILLPCFAAVYLRGRADGVRDYKRSKALYMAMESQYWFGCSDGLRGVCHSGAETPRH